MKKSTRALVGLLVIEALLFGGAAWMVMQVKSGNWQATTSQADAISTITTITGGAMSIVLVVLAMAFVVHRRRGN